MTHDRPHLGVILPNYGEGLDAARLAAAARAAEGAGFDSGWVTDHVMVPPEIAPIYGNIAEALVSLGYLAGCTTHLRLGVSALVVPPRDPLVTLKQLTSLDHLSGGRVLTAVAAGWLEGEFRNLGASFADRGRRLDEWIDLALEAFEQMPGPIHHQGGIPVDGAYLGPRLTTGPIEMWIAGVSRATLRRATRTGVWHPVALPPAELRDMAARFRELRPGGRVILRIAAYFDEEARPDARDERGRHAVRGPGEWLVQKLTEYLEAGCDGFVVNLDHERPGLEERIERFGAQVARSLPATR